MIPMRGQDILAKIAEAAFSFRSHASEPVIVSIVLLSTGINSMSSIPLKTSMPCARVSGFWEATPSCTYGYVEAQLHSKACGG